LSIEPIKVDLSFVELQIEVDLGSFGDPDGLEHQMKCYIGPNDDDLSILNRKKHEKYY